VTAPTSPPIGASPFTLRRWSLEHELRPLFQRVFEERPEVRSVLLAVAQHWADEADDAVHGHLVMSAREVPRWPHRCADDTFPGDGDLCSYCCSRDFDDPRVRWVSWDENGLAIRCWQAFCLEGGSQDDDPNFASVPVLVGRRHEGGVAFDFVTRCGRPWLDLPTTGLPTWFLQDEASTPLEPIGATPRSPDEDSFRAAIAAAPRDDGPRLVFADWLEQRGDPLGEFIALSLTHPRPEAAAIRRRALVQTHAEAWLGELVACVPVGSANFSRGLLTAATVCFDEKTEALAQSPVWSTVEHLEFAETSRCVFSKSMGALSSVAGLRREGVAGLPSTVTQVACRPDVALAALPATVKALTLTVPFEAAALAPVRTFLRQGNAARLERFAVAFEPVGDDTAEPPWALVRELLSLEGPRVVAVGGWAPGQGRTGWWLERVRSWEGPASLSLEGFSTFQSADVRAGLLRAFAEAGGTRVKLRSTGHFRPSASEREALARGGLDVEFEEPEPASEPPPLPVPPRPPPRAMPLVVDPISRAVSFPVEASARPGPGSAAKVKARWLELALLVGAAAALTARACG
jgi:uncharacterized protein (TIGR02996 family)